MFLRLPESSIDLHGLGSVRCDSLRVGTGLSESVRADEA